MMATLYSLSLRGRRNLASQYDTGIKIFKEGVRGGGGRREWCWEQMRGRVPRWDAGAVVLVGEAHDELARVERERPGGVEVLAAVVGREAHPEVGRAVEADQLRHDGPVHGPRAHLRRDLDLRNHPHRRKGLTF